MRKLRGDAEGNDHQQGIAAPRTWMRTMRWRSSTPRPIRRMRFLDVGKRDLPSELRERYWIEQGEEAGVDERTWTGFGIVIPWKFERHELGWRRNEPGDGFRYVFRAGTAGAGGRVEWFEITEVFEGGPC